MANYVKSTDFAAKDQLQKGDPAKKIVGSEIDHEFNSIADSVRTKVDKVLGSTPDAVALLNAQGEVIDSGRTLQDLLLEMLPVSTVLPYAGTLTIPDGFLRCEGQAVSRNTYSALFQQIGTTYGTGNGTTTFNLPNLVSRFPLGSGGDRAVGSTGGEEKVVLTRKQLPTVTGSVSPVARTDRGLPEVDGTTFKQGKQINTGLAGGSIAGTGFEFDLGGEDEPHENMPPFVVINYIIKY